jgi:hypothetical protein
MRGSLGLGRVAPTQLQERNLGGAAIVRLQHTHHGTCIAVSVGDLGVPDGSPKNRRV